MKKIKNGFRNTVPKEHHEGHIWGAGVNFTDLFFFKKYLFIFGCVASLQHVGSWLTSVGVRV